MKKEEIVSVLYELHKITGFRMSLHNTNYEEIASYPEGALPFCKKIHENKCEYAKCFEYDKTAFKRVLQTKEPYIYKCRHGMCEAISPLYNFGILTGFLMMGQIRDGSTSPEELKRSLTSLGILEGEACELICKTPSVSSDILSSYVKIMTICAQYLTLSNAIPSLNPSIAETANRYIHENLDKRITIRDICDFIGCSKTTLISAFKREFGTTVNEAITDARIEEAKKLLSLGKMSIYEVASSTGFYDQSYFSKVFSQKTGLTPTEYKKELGK